MRKLLLLISLIFAVHTTTAFAATDALETLPVQDGGRVKPFGTFARDMLHLVWGKETYHNRTATEVVFSWMLLPEEWEKSEIILVRHSGLREALQLSKERLYYTPQEIVSNPRMGLLVQELNHKKEAQEKLNPFDQAVQTLENQVSSFHVVRLGVAVKVFPQEGSTTWKSVRELEGEEKTLFDAISKAFVSMATSGNKAPLNEAVENFVKHAEAKFGDYSQKDKVKVETLYNSLTPFHWAWMIYLVALFLFAANYFGQKPIWGRVAWPMMFLGMLFHVAGFGSRMYILGRPPVSNMFETVAWVSFVALVMASIIYRFTKLKVLPFAATMVSTLGLILCDVSASVLDDTMTPLVPVLRDNFWLMTHVIIIVSSYALFFLAFFIGDIVLYYYVRDENKYQAQIASGVQAIYRAIQVGVVLLAAGTILGGVWADYSWGRFWGWDPKETWAFIALMGYIIVLHGRIAGWLKNYGLTAAAVVAFSTVIMSWYGVNFVLGAGLHTYGFGAGGVEYVAGFVALHLLYVVFVTTLRQSRRAKTAQS